jgi:putative flippase GtrA
MRRHVSHPDALSYKRNLQLNPIGFDTDLHGLQLAALSLFNRWTAGHYLYASAAAIELTLLHNFMWHLHYTWRDRRDGATRLRQFVRFHLSNGLLSMLGNLALMRLLVHEARLPLLVSNVIAILCCSMVNFSLGNNWAFAGARRAERKRSRWVKWVLCVYRA